LDKGVAIDQSGGRLRRGKTMLAIIASLFATAMPVAAPARPLDAPVTKQGRLLGGFNDVDVKDAGVQAAAAFAAASVDAELGEVTSAQRQSAAGSNYRISFTTTDGASYNAVVRSDLRGTLSVTSIEEIGDHHGTAEEEGEQGGEE
jgi:hypothetical protein